MWQLNIFLRSQRHSRHIDSEAILLDQFPRPYFNQFRECLFIVNCRLPDFRQGFLCRSTGDGVVQNHLQNIRRIVKLKRIAYGILNSVLHLSFHMNYFFIRS